MSKKKKKSRKRNKTCVTLRTFFLGIEWTQMTWEWSGVKKSPQASIPAPPELSMMLLKIWSSLSGYYYDSATDFHIKFYFPSSLSGAGQNNNNRISVSGYPVLNHWVYYLLRSERVVVSAADLLLAKDVDKVYANRSPNFFYAQIKEKKSSNQSLLIY